MSDATSATCGNCGLPILDGEAVDWTPFPPRRLCHATHADCFVRLLAERDVEREECRHARVERDNAWERCASLRAEARDLREALGMTRSHLIDAEQSLAAALRVLLEDAR